MAPPPLGARASAERNGGPGLHVSGKEAKAGTRRICRQRTFTLLPREPCGFSSSKNVHSRGILLYEPFSIVGCPHAVGGVEMHLRRRRLRRFHGGVSHGPPSGPAGGTPDPTPVPDQNLAKAFGKESPQELVQDSTAFLPAQGGQVGSSTHPPIPTAEPPERIDFRCPCGRVLSAPRRLYGRRSKCSGCRTILLLNLMYRRDLDLFQIEPFRIDGARGA
jgi:hypothetical protein